MSDNGRVFVSIIVDIIGWYDIILGYIMCSLIY